MGWVRLLQLNRREVVHQQQQGNRGSETSSRSATLLAQTLAARLHDYACETVQKLFNLRGHLQEVTSFRPDDFYPLL